ncbi:accessory gene regulator B family protein [Paenibacillus allorhizosphaerae]|uniref:Accessory gene regulator protein B n=1 Tax=Paenibacillus allorhizosphaerae TaxID=2849866 RepID=A0ABM8VT38_9BACL|nr:Accessory gene regulator protein B [Paenibacillus allorhizosphaerae]
MNLIDRSATRIAKTIRENYPQAASEQVLVYALSLSINSILAISTTLFISYFTNHFLESITTIGCFLLLRYFSGGVHLNSSLACCLVTILVLTVLTHLSFNYVFLGLIFDIISIIILYLKAPHGIQDVSRINPKYYPVLKWFCILFVSSNFIIHSPLLSATFLVQTLTLTRIGNSLFILLERR